MLDNQWIAAAKVFSDAAMRKISRMTHDELRAFLPEAFGPGSPLAGVDDRQLDTLKLIVRPMKQ